MFESRVEFEFTVQFELELQSKFLSGTQIYLTGDSKSSLNLDDLIPAVGNSQNCFAVILAASIPALGLFISLVGAVSSSALALVYPAMSDIALRTCPEAEGPLRTKDQFFRWAFRSN